MPLSSYAEMAKTGIGGDPGGRAAPTRHNLLRSDQQQQERARFAVPRAPGKNVIRVYTRDDRPDWRIIMRAVRDQLGVTTGRVGEPRPSYIDLELEDEEEVKKTAHGKIRVGEKEYFVGPTFTPQDRVVTVLLQPVGKASVEPTLGALRAGLGQGAEFLTATHGLTLNREAPDFGERVYLRMDPDVRMRDVVPRVIEADGEKAYTTWYRAAAFCVFCEENGHTARNCRGTSYRPRWRGPARPVGERSTAPPAAANGVAEQVIQPVEKPCAEVSNASDEAAAQVTQPMEKSHDEVSNEANEQATAPEEEARDEVSNEANEQVTAPEEEASNEAAAAEQVTLQEEKDREASKEAAAAERAALPEEMVRNKAIEDTEKKQPVQQVPGPRAQGDAAGMAPAGQRPEEPRNGTSEPDHRVLQGEPVDTHTKKTVKRALASSATTRPGRPLTTTGLRQSTTTAAGQRASLKRTCKAAAKSIPPPPTTRTSLEEAQPSQTRPDIQPQGAKIRRMGAASRHREDAPAPPTPSAPQLPPLERRARGNSRPLSPPVRGNV